MTQPLIMLIVDVERDWGGMATRAVREVLPSLLHLLERYSVTATFFVVADLTALLADLLPFDGPHEIGSHGLTHKMLTKLQRQELIWEIVESKRELETYGYRISGFRAPYLETPPDLLHILSAAGYRYDASSGAVYPRLSYPGSEAPHRDAVSGLFRMGISTLSTGWVPFNLTYLRMFEPVGVRLVPKLPTLFSFHLHELLADDCGWRRIPPILRRLHMRNSGASAWAILESLLRRFGPRFVSCRAYLEAQDHG